MAKLAIGEAGAPEPRREVAIGTFPGADFSSTERLPPRCDLDGGPWQPDPTGVHCQTCRRRYVVANVIRRTLRIPTSQSA